jgi:hypothetical protein
MTSQTIGSDFTDGTLLPNYVDGRVLVAGDLATGQAGLQALGVRAGQAAGAGVVRGLWVTPGATSLSLTPGLGLARSGQPVVLPKAVTLPLVSTTTTPGPGRTATFSCCAGPGPSTVTTGLAPGDYLLTARPASRTQGSSPLGATPGSTFSPGCTAQWTVEGVEFRVITIPLPAQVNGMSVTPDNHRNLVAHWILGTEQLARLPQDPFAFAPAYSGLDRLGPADLSESDLPLAVFAWNGQSVTSLDNWPARRRITTPDPVTAPWSALVSDRRAADGQARFLQFQEQLQAVVAAGTASSVSVQDVFGFIPPVGFVPVSGISTLDAKTGSIKTEDAEPGDTKPVPNGGTRPATPAAPAAAAFRSGSGFDPFTFFGRLADPGGTIDWEVANFALQQSWTELSVPTDLFFSEGPAPLTYYYVQQNLDSQPAGNLYVVYLADLPWQYGPTSNLASARPARATRAARAARPDGR